MIGAAPRLIAVGHSVDLGPWQINSRNLAMLDLGIGDAFEPCKAVAAAARLIELFSRYNTGSPSRGIANGYAAAVMTAIHAVKAARPAMLPATCRGPTANFRTRPVHDAVADRAGISYSQPRGVVDVLVNDRPADFDLCHRHVRTR